MCHSDSKEEGFENNVSIHTYQWINDQWANRNKICEHKKIFRATNDYKIPSKSV